MVKQKHLYVIQFGTEDIFKIGITTHITRRIASLQTSCPRRLTLVEQHELPSHHAIGLERALHRRLRPYQTYGEWFALSHEQIKQELKDVARIYTQSRLRERQERKMRSMRHTI